MDRVVLQTRAGAVLVVRVKPQAQRDAVLGADSAGLRVSVRAAPEKGKANAAVEKTLARWLGVAPSTLEVVAGSGARDKRVLVRGLDAGEVRARVAARLAG